MSTTTRRWTSLFGSSKRSEAARQDVRKRRGMRKLFMEPLEDRRLLAHNVIISTAATSGGSWSGGVFTPTADDANVQISDLVSQLTSNASVTINTGATGSQRGGVTLQDNLDFNTIGVGKTLTLQAADIVKLVGSISQSSPANDGLNLIFDADSDSNGAGIVLVENNIDTIGTISFQDSTAIEGTSAVTIASGGQNISVSGGVVVANTNGVTLASSGGNISVSGTVDSGNAYQFVSGAVNYHTALTNARNDANSDGDRADVGDSYLVTITSAVENSIVAGTAGYVPSWFGGSDEATEGDWKWMDGPEQGQTYWVASGPGTGTAYGFVGWGSGEPNGGTVLPGSDYMWAYTPAFIWDDIQDSAVPYVKETNLAPTNLTLNAGAGGVTVGGNIGSGKQLQNLTLTSSTLSATGVNLAGTLSVTNSGAGSITGVIAGTAALTKAGAGTLALSGSNTYTGATSVNDGTLAMTNNTALGGTAGATTVAAGATLDFSGGITVGETLNLNGTLINSAGNNIWSGPITLGSTIDVAAGTTLTVSGPIGGTSLTKTGTGTLVLTGTNTYTGLTNVNAGILEAGSNSALGASSSGTVVASGATLRLNGTSLDIGAEPLTISGTGVGGTAGAIQNSGTTDALVGPVTLAADATIHPDAGWIRIGGTSGTANLAINSANSRGVFLNSTGGGNLNHTGSTTLTGSGQLDLYNDRQLTANSTGLFINGSGSHVRLRGTNNIADTESVTVGAGATFELANGDETIGSLSGAVGATVTLGSHTLTTGNNTNTTYSGSIGGTGGLIKTGTGTFTLAGANSYGGTTAVNQGTLLVNGTNSGTGAVSVGSVSGGTLGGTGTIGGTVTVNTNGTITGATMTTVGTLTVGGLSFNGGTYHADLSGNTSDMISTAGAVDLQATLQGVFTLDNMGGSTSDTHVFTLINNTAAGAIVDPPLSGAAEGATVTVNGKTARYSYVGGAGVNDMTLIVDGAVTYTGTGAGEDFQLRRIDNGGNPLLQLLSGVTIGASGGVITVSGGTVVDSRPFAGVTSYTVDGAGGDDKLVIDYSVTPQLQSKNVTFTGGTGTDALYVSGGTFGKVVYNYTNATDGNIQNFTNPGDATPVSTITYTGLEPITNTGTVTDIVFNLPASGNVQAILEDDGTTPNTLTRLRSSPVAFEQTDFAEPTGSLTINRGSATDDVTVNALPDFDRDLTIGSGAGPFDQLSLAGAVTLGAGENLTAAATTINVTAAVSTATTGTIDLTATRNISLSGSGSLATAGGDMTLEANTAGSASGNFDGIRLDGGSASISSTTGASSLTGKGGSGGGSGIAVVNGAGLNSAGGAITLGGTATAGSADFSDGVYINGGGSMVNTGAGTITITGGSSSTGTSCDGVTVEGSFSITSAAGAIDITGTSVSANASHGVQVVGTAALTTGSGDIALKGTGQTGVLVSGSVTTTASGGDVSINPPPVTGSVTIGGTVLAYGAVSIGNNASGPVTINAPGAINSDSDNSGGEDLTILSSGAISQATGSTIDANTGGAFIRSVSSTVSVTDVDSAGANQLAPAMTTHNNASPPAAIQIRASGTATVAGVDATGAGAIVEVRSDSGNIQLGDVDATTSVFLQAAGAITDNNTASNNVTAVNLALVAAAGIGSGDYLETDVDRLAASNTTSGNIEVRNHDANASATNGLLIIGTVGTLVGVSNADPTPSGGSIWITNHSPVSVSSPVTDSAGGPILIAAEGTAVTDDLTVSANITASGGAGSISLYAGDSIEVQGTPTARTISAASTGAILLRASTNYNNSPIQDGYNGGSGEAGSAGRIVMQNGSLIQSQDGNITLRGDGDLLLSAVDANSNNNATVGNVTISADDAGQSATMADGAGAIIDNQGAETANIRANLATLTAATGIGSTDDIETDVTTIAADNDGTTGDIQIYEVAPGAPVNPISVNQLSQSNAGGSGNLLLTTEDGDINIISGPSGVTVAGSGQVTLDANADTPPTEAVSARGSIDIDAVISTNGGNITLNADHDITSDANGDISSGGGNVAITADTNSSGLGSNNDGTIQTAGDVTAGTGTVTLSLTDCDGNMTGNIVSASDVIKNGSGALRLSGPANAYTGTTNVNAGTLLINGNLTADTAVVHVNGGGTLGGIGTIGTTAGARDVIVYPGGVLDPGDLNSSCSPLPGILTVNGDVTVQQGGTFRVQLNGLTAGTGYDQLALNGLGNLTGDLTGSGGSTLTIQTSGGIPVGAEYRIIDNDLTDLITTRFQGLPEGAFLTAGGVLMNISYLSGDNDNDVTLTAPGRFDFNGFHGYTADNYVGVSPFQQKTGSNSAGWQTPPPRWFERNYPVNPPYTTSEERLRYDGQATDTLGNPLTFETSVVAGKAYSVCILTGDSMWNHDKQQFQVWDGSTPAPPLTPVDPANLPPNTQVVSTWGGGAPEGGATINNGGGTANPPGTTGFYRWVCFTTASIVDGPPADGIGTLLMRMRDLGGGDPATVILAMDIRPVDTVGQLTITRTSPASGSSPFTALEVDGRTVDSYQGTGAPPGATITVTVSAGSPTQYAAITPDVDTTMFGGQVTADANGTFTFSVLRPATLAGSASPEDWTISAQERSGLSRGTATQPYTTPNAAPLRFDFGDYNSAVDTANGFLQVEPRTTYNGTRGYGWTTRVASKTRIDTINPAASTALRRDFNYSRNGIFRIDLAANTQYNIRTYHANPRNGTTPFVQDTFQVYTNTNLPYAAGSSVLAATIPAIAAGTTEFGNFSVTTGSSGVLFLDFRSLGAFLISGVEISAGVLPGAVPLLAAGDPSDGGAPTISLDMLQPVVTEATARWSDTGLTPAQAATLSKVQFAVADLGGAYLGLANPATNQIRIDDDAARLGWAAEPSAGGVDLLTVVMHEMGHLLGSDHSDDDHDLMAPVLSASPLRAYSFDLRPSSAKRAEAVEPLGQAEWRTRLTPFMFGPSSRASGRSSSVDDVFAQLDRESASLDGASETASTWLQSADDGLWAARSTRSGEETTQARVPRRSRLPRFERELDAWFAELAAEESGQ